jgi:hypothetical protein
VATLGCDLACLEAGRACADDENVLGHRGRVRSEFLLTEDLRVVQAADLGVALQFAVHTDVRADTRPDPVRPPVPDLLDQVGVGDVGPGHGDHVAVARGEQGLGHTGGEDPPDTDDGDVDLHGPA